MMVGCRAWNTAYDLVVGDSPQEWIQGLTTDTPPVAAQGVDGRRMGDDRRCPLDRMDLCQKRRIDEPRFLEQLFVRPVGVGTCKAVANGIVLAREQPPQHAQSQPPAGPLGELVEQRCWQQLLATLLHHAQFSSGAGADARLYLWV